MLDLGWRLVRRKECCERVPGQLHDRATLWQCPVEKGQAFAYRVVQFRVGIPRKIIVNNAKPRRFLHVECQRNRVVMGVVLVGDLREKAAANQQVARVLKVFLAHWRAQRESGKRCYLGFREGFHSLGADFVQGGGLRIKPTCKGKRKEKKQNTPKSPLHEAIVAKQQPGSPVAKDPQVNRASNMASLALAPRTSADCDEFRSTSRAPTAGRLARPWPAARASRPSVRYSRFLPPHIRPVGCTRGPPELPRVR